MKPASLATRFLQCASISSLLLLAACGKHEAASPATTTPASSVAAATMRPAATGPARASTAKTEGMPASAGTSAVITPAPAASSASPFAFDKLTLGDAVNAEHKVTHVADHFASNDKTLYASVDTVGSSKGATLNAKWRYLEGPGQLVSSISQSIATDGPAITTFKVENPDLWPEGKYKIEISIDGKPVASQDFQIAKR